MNIIERIITWANEEWVLTNQRVLYWSSQNILILSDVHIGKGAHFRKHGIPIPILSHQKDIARLHALIIHYRATRVIVVGDLLHASNNSEVRDFKNFLSSLSGVELILVKGNHDRLAEHNMLELGISAVHTCYSLKGIRFVHEPLAYPDGYQLSGHIHPGISLRLPTNKHLRLPAYAVSDTNLLLPAFSLFTGLNTGISIANAVYYGFSDSGIYEVR